MSLYLLQAWFVTVLNYQVAQYDFVFLVITSYSIHYTKLYEHLVSLLGQDQFDEPSNGWGIIHDQNAFGVSTHRDPDSMVGVPSWGNTHFSFYSDESGKSADPETFRLPGRHRRSGYLRRISMALASDTFMRLKASARARIRNNFV